jgi:hypothetical protein
MTDPDVEGEAVELELDRRMRANRAIRGALAALLCLEAFVVLLVPRTIAQTATGLNGTKTGLLLALAVVLVAAGFMLTRPWGIGLGSAMQVLVASTALLEGVMIVIAVCFIAIWLYLLNLRHELVGTANGVRMLFDQYP